MKKCIHKINIGFEPTFGNNLSYGEVSQFRDGELLVGMYNYDIYGSLVPRVCESSVIKSSHKAEFNKIGFNMHQDSGCFECPSIKEKFNTENPLYFFKQFGLLIKTFGKYDYKPSSSYNEIENEGGGHIHLSTQFIDKKGKEFKKKFIRNLYNFTINNPELNWIFNDPWDADNANSLLSYVGEASIYSERTGEHLGYKKVDYNDLIDFYEEDEISKEFPIINRENLKTLEFRFLMMPRTVEELELHYDLVISIYNYIWKMTSNNKVILPKYKNLKEIQSISKSNAKINLIETFKTLKLSNKDIKEIEKIKFPFLEIRYDYKGLLV